MNQKEIHNLVSRQRRYFQSGATLPLAHRFNALKKLEHAIIEREDEIHAALKQDLGKSSFESYLCETSLVLSELSYMKTHLFSFSRNRRVTTPLAQFASHSYIMPSPKGVVLVMSPWNYPFLLTLDPLIDALAAGNTVILKPSAYAPHTSALIQSLVTSCFPAELAAVVYGGREENSALLKERFDHIFFTGSPSVGKIVMKQAAEHLTPITLELGGKSPCIVDETANLPLAARRIVFGKFLNCGQTCVAPDYIYCHASIRDRLIRELEKEIRRQFGAHPLDRSDYGKIINEKHFNRLMGLMDPEKILTGGKADKTALRIEPTLLAPVSFQDPIMQEEIFGPLLPVVTYETLKEAISTVNRLPHPLALYVFTKNQKTARKITSRCGFGGGCINDTVIHLATSHMGFGGFGESGMGSYHGKAGFDTFSHYKSIVDKKTWLDLPMRYQPYRKWKKQIVQLILRKKPS